LEHIESTSRSPSARREFIGGVKAELPILLGVIPFGMIYGVLALSAGMSVGAAQAMSIVVFAGSAQFVSAQLIQAGTPAAVIVITVGIINLRHALYSASLASYLKPLRPAWKWLLAYLLTDEAYAVTITHYQEGREYTNHNPSQGKHPEEISLGNRHWFFLGAGLALWTTWQASTAVGIFLGAVVPSSWSLDFTLALTFIALVVPGLTDRPGLAAALSAGITAILAYNLPFKLGLVLAAVVGILVGLWSESRQ
jgi:4-azaleucine resistance transporter AzlC